MKGTCLFDAEIDNILSFDLIHPKGQGISFLKYVTKIFCISYYFQEKI